MMPEQTQPKDGRYWSQEWVEAQVVPRVLKGVTLAKIGELYGLKRWQVREALAAANYSSVRAVHERYGQPVYTTSQQPAGWAHEAPTRAPLWAPRPAMVPPPMPTEPPAGELQRILIIPDVHAPYHDREAWATLLAAGRAFRPDIVVVLGDFFDFYAVSFHEKSPTRASKLEAEVSVALDCLDELDQLARRKVFVKGNHEARFDRYLAKHAPALFGCVTFEGVVGLERRGWEVVEYKRDHAIGELLVTHDLDRHGKYAAVSAANEAGQSCIIGHVHRMQLNITCDANGKPLISGSLGWLGDRNVAAEYKSARRAKREWPHGFGVAYLEPDGTVHLVPVPIVEGRCVVEGQLIRRA